MVMINMVMVLVTTMVIMNVYNGHPDDQGEQLDLGRE